MRWIRKRGEDAMDGTRKVDTVRKLMATNEIIVWDRLEVAHVSSIVR